MPLAAGTRLGAYEILSSIGAGGMGEAYKAHDSLEKLDKQVADDLNLAWHRLDTWPDLVPGFVRLKRKFMLAPCSNGRRSGFAR